MRLPISLMLLAGSPALAGPVDFGMTELNAAIAARDFKYKPRIMAELDIDAPETFHIEPYAAGGGHITGGDLRGLMYGLLEAAEQMRSTGHLKPAHGVPAMALRGIRVTVDPEAAWFTSAEFWNGYFAGLARDRFNRLEMSFESAPGPGAFSALRSIAQTAARYGVDVAIGFGVPDVSAIEHLLTSCPSVRAIVLHHPEGLPDVLSAAQSPARRRTPSRSGASRQSQHSRPDRGRGPSRSAAAIVFLVYGRGREPAAARLVLANRPVARLRCRERHLGRGL